MMKASLFVPAIALLLGACASSNPQTVSTTDLPPAVAAQPSVQAAAPPKPAFEPAGNYEFSTTVQGQTVNGTIDIMKRDGGLGGRIMTDMTGEIPITSVVVDGMKLSVNASMPDGPLGFTMTFSNANDFTGSWSYGGESGELKGRRKV